MNEKGLPVSKKSGLSCAVIGLVGCGAMLLLGIVVAGAGAFFGFRYLAQQIDEFVEPFEKQGYERVAGQVVIEKEKIEKSKVYAVQILKVQDGATADLAIMAQVAEIEGTVEGDIVFFGQVLKIKDGAVVKGNIDARAAQVIEVRGIVEGEITGTYQTLNQPRGSAAGKKVTSEEAPMKGESSEK